MFCMYILRSLKDNQLYIGSTNNLKKRLKEHNSDLVTSTKTRIPFKLVYVEGYVDEGEARHREQNLKLRARALHQLLKRIQKSINS